MTTYTYKLYDAIDDQVDPVARITTDQGGHKAVLDMLDQIHPDHRLTYEWVDAPQKIDPRDRYFDLVVTDAGGWPVFGTRTMMRVWDWKEQIARMSESLSEAARDASAESAVTLWGLAHDIWIEVKEARQRGLHINFESLMEYTFACTEFRWDGDRVRHSSDLG